MHHQNNVIIFLVALFLACFFITATSSYSVAQEKNTLFDLLFGPKQPAQPTKPKKENNTLRKKPVTKTQPKLTTAPVAQSLQPAPLAKAQNAKKILIIGDFIASAMADGLNELYADNENYQIIKRTDGSSGLVRDDYYDWHNTIAKIIAEEKPDIIIFAIGANDRQAFEINKKTIEYGREEWDKIYQARISAIVNDLEETKKPWLWAGLPSFGKASLHQSAGRFNAFYNAAIANTNGKFIDLWSGFVDDKGSFAISGYDMNGQTARLRNNDGVSFTPLGRQKLAFYVTAPIEAIWDTTPPTSDITMENIINDKVETEIKNDASDNLPPSPVKINAPQKKILHIPPTNLTDLNDKAKELEGANPRSDMQLHRQSDFDEQKGRADYFGID